MTADSQVVLTAAHLAGGSDRHFSLYTRFKWASPCERMSSAEPGRKLSAKATAGVNRLLKK